MTDDLLTSLTDIITTRDIDTPQGVLLPVVKTPACPAMITVASA